MRYWLLALASLGTLLLYLLAMASGSTSRFADWYWELFALNGLLLVGLGTIIGRQLWQLRLEIKERVFGAKLTRRMVTMFALVSVLPGILLFTVSVLFLNRSIESWFNVRVEAALDRGLNLGRNALDYLLADLANKGEYTARTLAEQPSSGTNSVLLLSRLREQLGVQEIAVFDAKGRLLAFAGNEAASLSPMRPTPEMLISVQHGGGYRAIESVGGHALALRVVLPIQPLGWNGGDRKLLQLLHPAPPQIAEDAQLVENTRAEYRQLALSREGLKQLYRQTLTVTLLLALFAAIALGMLLSRRISAPLSDLAAGTRAVAKGDFSRKHRVHRRDELGVLTAMFNRMTRQLAEARADTDASRAEIEANKAYLESILGNLSAGVLAFDGESLLRAHNVSAERILDVDFTPLADYPLADWPAYQPHLAPVVEMLLQQADALHSNHDWQCELHYSANQGERLLLARGTRLPDSRGHGVVLVFDDITELVRAQRDAAWGEVAKRLAHEIRNPLTPIQLSAERLQMKLAGKLQASDADMLQRSTDTIVKQVAALKRMVDAFRDYARAPSAKLIQLDVNDLLRDVLALYEGYIDVQLALHPQPLFILGDATLLRQVLHNLLSNAQDAMLDVPQPMLHISTNESQNACIIIFNDNGPGFNPDILPRAFEPYVTNKTKGTGLGLAVVKKILEEHQGNISVGNRSEGGAQVVLTLPLLETPCEVATS